MKIILLALCSVLFLAACSESGSSGGKKGVGPDDFNPQVKPSNPAPQAYILQTFAAIDDAKRYHPEDAAIFSSIIENNEIKQVDYYTQQNAINKLDSAGRDLVTRIRQNCFLNPAQKSKSGTPEKSIEKLSLSSSGANCNFIISRNIDVTITQSQPVLDKKSGWVSGTSSANGTEMEVRELRDANVQNYTKLVAISNQMTTSAQMNFRVNQNSAEQNIDLTTSGEGSMKITLLGGEVLQGPVTIWEKITSQRTQYGESKTDWDLRYKFEGKSPKGSVHLVLLSNKEGSRAFINGEEISAGSVGSIKRISQLKFEEMALSAFKAL